jgi:membrane-associated phospholipid phosphatase
MTAATAVSIFRIIDNRHWASDVLLGAGLGLFSGLALPRLIHVNPPRFGRRGERQAFFFMVPEMQRDSVGLRMIGIF